MDKKIFTILLPKFVFLGYGLLSAKKDSMDNLEDMDFDIDDIDKELEMALERKRVGYQTIR